MKEAIHYIG